jgi:transcriptional regulator with XRE-family HTH domain
MTMDVRTIRHHNLLRLVREAGGQKRLAERTGVSAAYVSQVLSRKVNRHVGHSMARRLEEGMDKPYGWMDVLSDPGSGDAFGPVREVDVLPGSYGRARVEGARHARVLALAGAAGGPEALARRARVHPAYLARLLEGRDGHGLAPDLARRLEAAMDRPHGWIDRTAPEAGRA